MDDKPEPLTKTLSDAKERSLTEDLRQLAEDARVLAEAELVYQKARAAYAGDEVKRITIFGLLAAVLAFFAMMALVVGLVFALATVITPWGSTAVVTIALGLLAGFCAMRAASRFKKMKAHLMEDKGRR